VILVRGNLESTTNSKQIATCGGLHPLHPSDAIRHSGLSGVSVTSSDSGYISMSTEIDSPNTPAASSRNVFGGLSALFKWKEKAVATLGHHHQNILQIPQIREPPSASSPARDAPAPVLTR
jgi:hypothetical protein